MYGVTSAWPIYSDGSYPFLIAATTLLSPHQARGATNSALFALWLGPWRGLIALNIDRILSQPGRNGPPRSDDRFEDILEVRPTLPRSCRTRRHHTPPIRRRYRRAGGATSSFAAPFQCTGFKHSNDIDEEDGVASDQIFNRMRKPLPTLVARADDSECLRHSDNSAVTLVECFHLSRPSLNLHSATKAAVQGCFPGRTETDGLESGGTFP